MALIKQRRQVAVAVESVDGTPETLAAGDAFLVFDPVITPTVSVIERDPARTTLSQMQRTVGSRSVVAAFTAELKGSGTAGTAPQGFNALMRACGMAETINAADYAISANSDVTATVVTHATASFTTGDAVVITGSNSTPSIDGAWVVTVLSATTFSIPVTVSAAGTAGTVETGVCYSPASSSIPSVTIGLYSDGLRYLIAGARGTAKIEQNVGERVSVMFEFTGQISGNPTDVALLTGISYDATNPEPFLSTALTIHGDTLKIGSLMVDLGNEVSLRPDVTTASGYIGSAITNRMPVGNIDPETELVATHDHWGKWLAGTEGRIAYTLGSTAGNIVHFNIPRAQYTSITDADREGYVTSPTDFSINMVNGDDEMIIGFI